jgi:hypothetical protein
VINLCRVHGLLRRVKPAETSYSGIKTLSEIADTVKSRLDLKNRWQAISVLNTCLNSNSKEAEISVVDLCCKRVFGSSEYIENCAKDDN